jgi:hypothetical protein
LEGGGLVVYCQNLILDNVTVLTSAFFPLGFALATLAFVAAASFAFGLVLAI